MKPSPELVLNQAFAKLAMEIGPALPAGYGQGSVTTTAGLLLLTAQEFNRAADVRAKENAAMRRLFGDVTASIGGKLGEELKTAAGSRDKDLTIATLDQGNASLKTTLIALQTHAEDTRLGAVETRIARLLQEFADARQVFFPVF